MAWTPLCDLTDLAEGVGRYVQVGGLEIALFLHHGRVYALDNRCPHAGANLAGGWIEDDCVVCPKHCWPFRLADGQLRDTPGVNVDAYAARVEGGRVEVDLPADTATP